LIFWSSGKKFKMIKTSGCDWLWFLILIGFLSIIYKGRKMKHLLTVTIITLLVTSVTFGQTLSDTTSINTEVQKKIAEGNKLVETDKNLRLQLNAVKAALFDNSERYNQLNYELYQLEQKKQLQKQPKK